MRVRWQGFRRAGARGGRDAKSPGFRQDRRGRDGRNVRDRAVASMATVSALQAPAARRQVTIGGKRVRVIDIHCHCVIDVSGHRQGHAARERGRAAAGTRSLGPQRLAAHRQDRASTSRR